MTRSLSAAGALALAILVAGCSSSADNGGEGRGASGPEPEGGNHPAIISRAEGPSFSESTDGAPPVAELDGRRVSTAEISALLLKRDPEMFHMLVNEVLLTDLAEREAEALGVEWSSSDEDDLVRKSVEAEIEADRARYQSQYQMQLEEALKQQGLDLATHRKNIEDRLRPVAGSSVAIERLARYHSLTTENVKAFRIVVAQRDLAEQLAGKLRQGASFGDLARQHSIDGFRKKGGELPLIVKGASGGGKIETMLFRMKAGEISDVIEEGQAYSIYMVQERSTGRNDPYSSVESEVLRSLAERPVDEDEINQWYHAAIAKHRGVKRYYDLPNE